MFSSRMKILLITAAALMGCAAVFSFAPDNFNRVLVKSLEAPALASIPHADIAIVLGAGLDPDHSLSNVARERVDFALEVYRAFNTPLLMTGGETAFGTEADVM